MAVAFLGMEICDGKGIDDDYTEVRLSLANECM